MNVPPHIFIHICLSLVLLAGGGCYQTLEFDPELDRVISIEALQSSDFGRALILHSDQYPCVLPGRCDPVIDRNAVLYVTGSVADTAVNLGCDNTCRVYFNYSKLDFQSGEQVTLTVLSGGNRYEATSIMPDSLDLVIDTEYSVEVENPGLLIRIDTVLMKKANGLYLQFYTDNSDEVIYGFIVLPDPIATALIPNNGRFVADDVYYIPDDEIRKAGVVVSKGDNYNVVARHVTPESAIYYKQFKQILATGNININNGLLFAPPETLPSNFDSDGFGFFHLFHEQNVDGKAK